MALSPQTLSVEDRRIVASWAAGCAEHVRGIYEDAVPDDTRVRAAIEQARAFAAGELDVSRAVRQRGAQAGAAARQAPTPAAAAAAYAAEQAAAVAHMGAHALGAAGYAAKASTLAAGRDDEALTQSEARRQVAAMTDAVAHAISSLPALGEDRSGPLGPGRLSGGHVGETIRAIQALVNDRYRTPPAAELGASPLERAEIGDALQDGVARGLGADRADATSSRFRPTGTLTAGSSLMRRSSTGSSTACCRTATSSPRRASRPRARSRADAAS